MTQHETSNVLKGIDLPDTSLWKVSVALHGLIQKISKKIFQSGETQVYEVNNVYLNSMKSEVEKTLVIRPHRDSTGYERMEENASVE